MNSKADILTAVSANTRESGDYARQVEEAGWHGIGIFDSQNLGGDTYVAMALAAAATERVELSTDVTNPLTRHPAVTAGAIASVQELSGGRAVLGIGRGDSALAYIGHAPVYANFFESYLKAVQTYLRGESVEFEDLMHWRGMAPHVDTLHLAETPEDSRLVWLDPNEKKVPVAVAASGPRVIGAAARNADVIMFALGADLGRLEWGLEQAKAARREAGLDPDGIRYGAYLNIVCHPQVEVARDLITFLDTFVRFSVMHGQTYGPVSEQAQKVLADTHRGFNMRDHSASVMPPAEFVDQFAIVGPPDTCIGRIQDVIGLGIDRIVVLGPTVGEPEGERKLCADLMAKEVLPAFSS